MKKILLQLVALGLMNTIANASSSYYLDPCCDTQESRRMQLARMSECGQSRKDHRPFSGDHQCPTSKEEQQILQALEIFASSLKPSTTTAKPTVAKDAAVKGAMNVEELVSALLVPEAVVKYPAVDNGEDVEEPVPVLVPAAGSATSLHIPSSDYVAQMKACSQQFKNLTNAVDDALNPIYSLAAGKVNNESLQPDESLKSLKSQAAALKKQLKELNAMDRDDYMEWTDSPKACHRNGKQHKEREAKKEQIKKEQQDLTEKIRQLKSAKKNTCDLEQLKRKILDDQKAAKDDNDRIEKSTARLKLVFDQATLERQNQSKEQSDALADALKEYLLKIDKEFGRKCSVTKQKIEIDLYTKKCTALKELARRQNKRALELLKHELAAELASFKLDFEKNLRDLQNAADVVRLIIYGGNEETTPIPALFCEAVKSSLKL